MKPIKEIVDFVNSNNEDKYISIEEINTNFKIIKDKIYDYTLISEVTSKNIHNPFLMQTTGALFLLNKDNDIIYTPCFYKYGNYIGFFIDGGDTSEKRDELKNKILNSSAELKNKVKDAVYDILIKELPTLDKKILDTINLNDFKEGAIKKYKNKEEINFPISEQGIVLSPEAIVTYIENKDKLKNIVFTCISDFTLEQYEKYVAENKCIADHIKELEENPLLIRQVAIQAIIEGDKQSYAITYHDQNGVTFKESFKKTPAKMKSLITQLFDYNLLNGIPIELVDTISWRNNILYDAKNYEPLTVTEKETAIRLYLLNKPTLALPKYSIDEEVMKAVVLQIPKYFLSLPSSFKKDEKFVLSIMEEIKPTDHTLEEISNPGVYSYSRKLTQEKDYIFEHADDNLINDKGFLVKYLNLLSGEGFDYNNDYKSKLLNAVSKYTKSYEFSKLCIKAIGIDEDLFGIIPEEFLNRKETLDIIKEIANSDDYSNRKLITSLFSHITNTENLKYMFDDNIIRINLSNVHDDIIKDRNFIFENISSNTMLNNRIYLAYEDDKEVIDRLIDTVDERKTNKIFDMLDIKITDSIKKFELCSRNISFISRLTKDEAMIFFEGELTDIENILINNGTILITTPNCEFNIVSDTNISIKNKNSEQVYVIDYYNELSQKLKSLLNNVLHDKYKLRSSKFESAIAEVIRINMDVDIER